MGWRSTSGDTTGGGGVSASRGDVGSSAVGMAAGSAGSDGGGHHGLGDSAGAVSDGEGGGLGDGVGLAGEGEGSGLRAVGGVGSDDLGGVGDIAVARPTSGGGTSESSDSEELHLD